MLLGYNTDGFALHRLDHALAIIREIGYESVGITLDIHLLDPPDRSGVDECIRRLRPPLAATGLVPTIETGARFLLDPRLRHQPTLVSRDPARRAMRIEYLHSAIDVAAAIGARCVSIWSGAADDDAGPVEVRRRLIEGLAAVLDHARAPGVRVALEPEPGMHIETMAQFAEVMDALPDPLLGLTLDVGHVHCLHDGEAAEHIRRWRSRLWNVHIEDMRRGRHEHLPFGEGEIHFAPILRALRTVDDDVPVLVELPRQAHDAVETARRSRLFLQKHIAAHRTAP
jgi:sugar phosphate isomerase/epimerase